ncbi:hypothetical protein KFE25_005675 [Diacronema lutheri]|uniref:Uncharacterized protein n=1 Tax=Diacronema lutheri TaxID=2081491 RepID=A0A8J5X8F3_DIALT|nr:hypothetical protein KFE25_005675 [Diacronema lutheri]
MVLDEQHSRIIERQQLFFMASAPAWSASRSAASHIELQPKARMTLAVVDSGTLAFADVSSSGGRAAQQLRAHGSGLLTLLILDAEASDGFAPLLRVSGRGFAIASAEIEPTILAAIPSDETNSDTSSRWVFVLHVEHAQFECDGLALVSPRSRPRASPELREGYPSDPYRTFSTATDFDFSAAEAQYEALHSPRPTRARLGSIPEHDVPPTPTSDAPHTARAQHAGARSAAGASIPPVGKGGTRDASRARTRSVPAATGWLVRREARGRRDRRAHAGRSWRSLQVWLSAPDRWRSWSASWRLPLASALLGIGAVTLAFESAALGHVLLRVASRGARRT